MLSGAAERFTSESVNRDRALLTPSACTVYSSSAGKHQLHQSELAERERDRLKHGSVCVCVVVCVKAVSEIRENISFKDVH